MHSVTFVMLRRCGALGALRLEALHHLKSAPHHPNALTTVHYLFISFSPFLFVIALTRARCCGCAPIAGGTWRCAWLFTCPGWFTWELISRRARVGACWSYVSAACAEHTSMSGWTCRRITLDAFMEEEIEFIWCGWKLHMAPKYKIRTQREFQSVSHNLQRSVWCMVSTYEHSVIVFHSSLVCFQTLHMSLSLNRWLDDNQQRRKTSTGTRDCCYQYKIPFHTEELMVVRGTVLVFLTEEKRGNGRRSSVLFCFQDKYGRHLFQILMVFFVILLTKIHTYLRRYETDKKKNRKRKQTIA